MSKFAANLTMLFTELPFLERFAAAREAGFAAVEFLFPYEWPAAELGRLLREHGLSQALFNMPPGNWGAGERGMAAIPGREAEFRAHLPCVRDYALALGCTKVHAMSGIVDPAHSLAAHRQTLVDNIRFAADFLAADGIRVLLEPLNDRDVPGYFLAHQLDALALVQEIDRPNVGVQLDLYHAQIMDGDLTRLIGKLGQAIGHVQIASVPDRHEPDEGELAYPHLFKVLAQTGYHDWIGCEYNPRAGTREGLSWLTQQ
ncbi:hydroxypyruvate isomerase family protein [Aeromonas rivipollensis]|uniref:2-oxo-tetronate isomerase n=1 Tax=Aeromonas rivipollensis TaxID=948519 RepID=UPI00259E48FC|nr:2-oxo-tetronate isomerase [Aeromonas rivipollensis]MDM5084653.1 hydroxypyruvate isomerase family protein [Aeromonas rivipollensis]MDM5096724.1 hydroxypyruvate isomerase family protein [Aeromonas rivipollensis]MDM5105049.1 hydroxypyruvate isomerase family protein [Aeromonas rivipollensis]